MWKKYGPTRQATDDNIMWHVCFACWIIKATDTYSEYLILTAFWQQQWIHERSSMLCYTYMPFRFMYLFLIEDTFHAFFSFQNLHTAAA